MATVSHLVGKYVRERPQLERFLERDLVSFHRLARYIRPDIEREMGVPVQPGAIVMALSRLRERMGTRNAQRETAASMKGVEISLLSDFFQADVHKTAAVNEALLGIQRIASKNPQDILSITQSGHEATIIAPLKYRAQILKLLQKEKSLRHESDLSLVVLKFGEQVLYQPGFFDRVLSQLAWEDINVFEIVSTLTELMIVLKDEQAARAYAVLRKMR